MDLPLAEAYLRLRHSNLIPSARLGRQLREAGSLKAVINQPGQEPLRAAVENAGLKRPGQVEKDLDWAALPGNHLLLYEQQAYPAQLRLIHEPPPILYVQGKASCLGLPQIAIVGSRKCSAYGRQVGTWLGRELSDCGLLVTSGLALGVDAAAHRGALSSASDFGRTVAVVATGLDSTYPARHRELAQDIREHGALVSEFPLGTPPRAHHFPRRNRLISGFALGVVVVEASLRSGSLISARFAMEQNREVFAVPGRLNTSLSEGCHHLIKNGAKLVEGPGDVLEELPESIIGNLKSLCDSRPLSKAPGHVPGSSDPRCQRILSILAQGEALFETLKQDSGLSTQTLHGCLLQLEIQGLLVNRGGRIALKAGACQH